MCKIVTVYEVCRIVFLSKIRYTPIFDSWEVKKRLYSQ